MDDERKRKSCDGTLCINGLRKNYHVNNKKMA